MGMEGEIVTSSLFCFLLQDYIFYLEPDKLESGKGKCSYDPKVDTVSALISESCGCRGWVEGTLPTSPQCPQAAGLPLLQALGHQALSEGSLQAGSILHCSPDWS